MSIKERVTQALNGLSETELEQVAEFLAFLRFRARLKARPPLDETQCASLYAAWADEDRVLAEEGLSDYVAGLGKEDTS